MIKLLLLWVAGVLVGLFWTWLSVRKPLSPMAESLTIFFGVIFSIFWPIVVVRWVVMGASYVVRWPEDIEP